MNFNQLCHEFIQKNGHLSPPTHQTYQRIIDRFRRFIDRNNLDIQNHPDATLNAFIASLDSFSDGYRKSCLYVTRKFLTFLAEQGHITPIYNEDEHTPNYLDCNLQQFAEYMRQRYPDWDEFIAWSQRNVT